MEWNGIGDDIDIDKTQGRRDDGDDGMEKRADGGLNS